MESARTVRWQGRLREATIGSGPIVYLSAGHGLAASADAFVSVSLAGSLFFNISPDASRQQVLLYLLITMIPLAVLSPMIGPAVDRLRRHRGAVAAGFYLVRALCCVGLVFTLLQLTFYPIALVLLIVSKASSIVKQALVRGLVDDSSELVRVNARLSRFASITASVGAMLAVAVLAGTGPEWTLWCAAVLYVSAAVAVIRLPGGRPAPEPDLELEYAEVHQPPVVIGAAGMIAIRAAVGFFVFTVAFSLRRANEPAYVYGLVGAAYAVGAFAGHTIAAILRRRLREVQMIAAAIALPAVFTAIGILGVSLPLLLVISMLVGLSTTLGRNAFDSLVQRVAPDAMLGRAGARYETQFQLAWVGGGVIAALVSLPVEFIMFVLTLIYALGLLLFVRTSGSAQRFVASSADAQTVARERLAGAFAAAELGAHGRAVVEAASAVDLVALDRVVDNALRERLDALRQRATDPADEIGPDEANDALEAAAEYVSRHSPT